MTSSTTVDHSPGTVQLPLSPLHDQGPSTASCTGLCDLCPPSGRSLFFAKQTLLALCLWHLQADSLRVPSGKPSLQPPHSALQRSLCPSPQAHYCFRCRLSVNHDLCLNSMAPFLKPCSIFSFVDLKLFLGEHGWRHTLFF